MLTVYPAGATSTRLSEKVGAWPLSTNPAGLMMLTVPLRLSWRQQPRLATTFQGQHWQLT